jgi:hypothetical protein
MVIRKGMTVSAPKIAGFLQEPKQTAQKEIYRGRFACPDVQWTDSGNQIFCTFTVTAAQVADAAASGLLWTDQDVQRGIQPGIIPKPTRELSLATGYPDPKCYIFDASNADSMVEKLLHGETLFLNPLIWNMRPGAFEAYSNEADRQIYIYGGKIYLPDSHHRHQAIIKAVSLWREAPRDYPKFSENLQFKVEMYFLTPEDEGNYFFDKNQRPKPTAKSKAYDLTTQDDLSLLAKRVIDKSKSLTENVNRVTDRLHNKNPQVLTLSTLREMMRTFSAGDSIDESELEGMSSVAAEFYDMLATVRLELSQQALAERKRIRDALVVDAAVMMQGYAHLMRDYNTDIARMGPSRARDTWKTRLQVLSKQHVYAADGWAGDLFEKRNPVWAGVGVTRVGNDFAKITVLNTGAARLQAGRVLRQLVQMQKPPEDITFLAKA